MTRPVVSGKGRRRLVAFRVRTNVPASVIARLDKGRHRVISRRWRIQAGTHALRLRLPARTRPGRYRLRVTVRAASSQSQRFSRRVRVRG
jgi:hypothetical protein